ncbi:hypothetical protein N9Y74_01385 [Alphaproteobacteria bacterium]|nr:hypothetical protein [Alphaproteobacteria bacterium]
MKTFDELKESIGGAEDSELDYMDDGVLNERLVRKGAALLIKAAEKRHGSTADKHFQSAKQKLRTRAGESVEEQLKRQNEAFMDICDGLIAVRNQVSANTNIGLTAVLLNERTDKAVMKAIKNKRL